ncbi:MAG TPA: chemotaxis protein CheW [Usitatibacter sp.]|nr:chemotaxis protein CheW [Usitatibacter sp.]
MNPADTAAARDEFLSFRLGTEEYAIDILQVREIREHAAPTWIADAPAWVKGVINLRGAIVPIVDLRARFGFEALDAKAAPVVIILHLSARPLGIVVDGVNDVVALAESDIRPAPEAIQSAIERGFVRGLAPVGERMLILVDLERLCAPALAAEPA